MCIRWINVSIVSCELSDDLLNKFRGLMALEQILQQLGCIWSDTRSIRLIVDCVEKGIQNAGGRGILEDCVVLELT